MPSIIKGFCSLFGQARQNFGVAELDGMIYVLGGEDEDIELLTVEVFDPHFNTWTTQTSMTMVRKVRHERFQLAINTFTNCNFSKSLTTCLMISTLLRLAAMPP